MNLQRPLSKQPIPENAKLAFKGVIFDVYQWEQEMFDGSTKTFEKIKRPDSVAIFPILDNGSILVTEQEQPGMTSFVDVPSGRVDEGEDPLDAAKRELFEETGYEAKEWMLWKAVSPLTKIDWVVYVFIAKGCTQTSFQDLDAGEKIAVKSVSFDQLLTMAHNDGFRAQEVVVDFLKAQLNPEKYKELQELFKPL